MDIRLTDLARSYGDIRRAHEAADAEVKKLAKKWDEIEKELGDAMIEAGVKSINVEGYGNFILSRSSYPSVTGAAKPQFFEYLKFSGNGDLLKLDVPAPTLSAFLKKHTEELRAQFLAGGITPRQADRLAAYTTGEGERPYADAHKAVGQPCDEMVADELAQALLKAAGASMFSKQGVSLKK